MNRQKIIGCLRSMNRQKIIVLSQIISLSVIVGYDSGKLMHFSQLGPQTVSNVGNDRCRYAQVNLH